MTRKTRNDTWTTEHDETLAQIVLKSIRTGGTQLKAFEEVAAVVGRTPAACGFRWNSHIKKEYQKEVKNALKARHKLIKTQKSKPKTTKVQKKDLVKQEPVKVSAETQNKSVEKTAAIDLDLMIQYLSNLKTREMDFQMLVEEKNKLLEIVGTLQVERDTYKNELQEIKQKYNDVSEEQKILMSIISRANKIVTGEGDGSFKNFNFQLDEEAKLERIS